MTSKVAVSNVALSTSLMKTAQQAVVVERDDATSNEADGASCPAQIGHDESWIAQDEGIVQCCNEMETHLPPTVCTAQLQNLHIKFSKKNNVFIIIIIIIQSN